MSERYHKKITDLPTALRPREKLMTIGVKKLSNLDLLAIIIGKGTRRENAIKIASRIIHKYKLKELPNISLEGWQEIPGIGEIKAVQLTAMFELSRRIFTEPTEEVIIVDSYEKILELLKDLRKVKKEHINGIYLDGQSKLLAEETIAIGRENVSYIHPKDIIQPAFIHDAVSFIVAHNHPNGKPEPSSEDIKLTERIKALANELDLHFADHIIVSENGEYSFKREGKL